MHVDMNLHLTPVPDVAHETDLSRLNVVERARDLDERLRRLGGTSGNVMILDESVLIDRTGAIEEIAGLGLAVTIMVEPRKATAIEHVNAAADQGASAIKFHPYIQQLGDDTFASVLPVASAAEARGMWVSVCCSYGTRDVYDISGPRLVAALVKGGIRAPIVALHAGGAAVLDVMAIALDTSNVLLDLSFSIPFWIGSSVEQDLAFAMRNVGTDRCMFGSDHPYVAMEDALARMHDFMDRHGFDAADRGHVLHETAHSLMSVGDRASGRSTS